MAKLAAAAYGEALFELAVEGGEAAGLLEEAIAVKDAFAQNAELAQFLNHPKISKKQKTDFVEETFGKTVSQDMTGFLVLAVTKDRQKDIPAILDFFIAKIKEYNKIGIVKVSTPLALSDEQKAKVEAKILSTTVYEKLEVEYSIDESLIGGMVIRIGDRIVDSSIKRKLEDLKGELLKIQLS